MSGEQAFALLVGLFCVSVIGLAVLFVGQVIAVWSAMKNLARDKGTIEPMNKFFDVSKRTSEPLTLGIYGCTGFAVIGFPERFEALIRSHTSVAVAFGIFGVGSGIVQIILGRRLKREVEEYAKGKGIEL